MNALVPQVPADVPPVVTNATVCPAPILFPAASMGSTVAVTVPSATTVSAESASVLSVAEAVPGVTRSIKLVERRPAASNAMRTRPTFDVAESVEKRATPLASVFCGPPPASAAPAMFVPFTSCNLAVTATPDEATARFSESLSERAIVGSASPLGTEKPLAVSAGAPESDKATAGAGFGSMGVVPGDEQAANALADSQSSNAAADKLSPVEGRSRLLSMGCT